MEEETAPKLVPIVVHSPVKVVPSETILKQESEKLRREAKEKLKNRAEKFGVKTVAEPIPGVTVPLKRKFRKPKQEAFPVGFDLFADEELVKKELRMHRFHPHLAKETEASAAAPSPVVEDESWKTDQSKREDRAAKFGVLKRELDQPPAEDGKSKLSNSAEKRKVRWKLARVVPGDTAAKRPDTLYVHGCDKLKSNDVFALFRLYGPSSLEWINDSSCNVTFADEFSAKRTLMSLGVKEEEADSPWFSLPGGRSMRIATDADVKPVFFDAQPPEERKIKEKRFGPPLAKIAGKRAREQHRVVERLAPPIQKEEEPGKEENKEEENKEEENKEEENKEEEKKGNNEEESKLVVGDEEEEIDIEN